MSDEKKSPSGGVRRVGEKDRKARLESSGSLFPPDSSAPSAPLPPTRPEDLPVSEPPEGMMAEAETAAGTPSPTDEVSSIDDDAAALLAELESNIEYDVEADDDEGDEDDTERFQRPVASEPYPMPARDRFPPLPQEQPEYPPLKMPRPQAPPAPPRKGGGAKFNILTLLFLLASCGLIAYFAFIWQNPYSALNPLAPFTPPPVMVSQTYTPSVTFTPSPTLTPSQTPTPVPSDTPTPLPTETPLEAEAATSPEVTVEAAAGFAFALEGGREIFITNPDGRGACRWSSIAGTVSDASGQALNEYQIRVLGDGVDETVISGTASGFGPGGFELQLGNEAVDAEFAVQLLDPSGAPVSDVLTVTTSSRCDWNISVLRFVQRSQ